MDRNATLIADAASDAVSPPAASEGEVVDEVLLEEISIDGMCGVY